MSRGVSVTQEIYDKVKQLVNTNLFTNQQIADMTGLSTATVFRVKASSSLSDMNAMQRAINDLSRKRVADRNRREQEAKEAYERAQEEVKQEESDADKFDNPKLKMDIMIEKLNTIIELLKQIRIAQTEPKGIPMPGPKAPF